MNPLARPGVLRLAVLLVHSGCVLVSWLAPLLGGGLAVFGLPTDQVTPVGW